MMLQDTTTLSQVEICLWDGSASEIDSVAVRNVFAKITIDLCTGACPWVRHRDSTAYNTIPG